MPSSTIYIAISLVALLLIIVLFFLVKRQNPPSRLTPLTSLAFAFVLAGIFFGEDPLIGYGLLGIGVLLAGIDILRRTREK